MPNNQISTLSIVVPVHNEADVLPEFHKRLTMVLDVLDFESEIIYVNDGSNDRSQSVINDFQDQRVTIIELSRNFGKEIALSAGLDHSNSDAVVVIDADLQDPPELIPELIQKWKAGYDNVYARRTARDGESLFKKISAKAFYRVIHGVSKVDIPENTGDFRLLSRRAVNSLKQLREHHRFMKGLFAWIGYQQIAVDYHRDPRFAGKTKWNYWQLWNFALDGITSFTITPLKIATYLGLTTASGSFLYAMFIIYKTLAYGDPVKGYPSLMVVILFLGGLQLFSLGIIGEYLGRMFDETKQRPLYLIKDIHTLKLNNSHNKQAKS